MDLGLRDRVYLVTGGSQGLGFAGARALVAEGAKVVVAARDPAVLADAITELGGSEHAVGLASDLTDINTAERLTAAAVAIFGRLDGCLISSGTPLVGSAMTVSDAQWREAFEATFLGPLRVARAAAAAIDRPVGEVSGTSGSILFVLASFTAARVPGHALSSGLRPGLASLVTDLADELGGRGIRVNAAMPGHIATDGTFALDARSGSPESVRRRNEMLIPLRRYG